MCAICRYFGNRRVDVLLTLVLCNSGQTFVAVSKGNIPKHKELYKKKDSSKHAWLIFFDMLEDNIQNIKTLKLYAAIFNTGITCFTDIVNPDLLHL